MSIIKMNLIKFVKYIASHETLGDRRFSVLAIFGLIITIFLPVRYVLPLDEKNILGFYSDFTALSVYGSMFFLSLLLMGSLLLRLNKNATETIRVKFAIVLLLCTALLSLAEYYTLSGYWLLRISCVLLLGYLVYFTNFWLKYKDFILSTFIILGVINAIIALIQFATQQSIGLHIIGESPISTHSPNVAKIVTHGTDYIRSYGLFPHPNILAGLLVIISTINLYLLNKYAQYKTFLALALSYMLLIAGVFTTLSRAGLLALIFSAFSYFVLMRIRSKQNFNKTLTLVIITFSIFTSIFYPWIHERSTWNDSAVIERNILANTTLEALKDSWLIGSGAGTNILQISDRLPQGSPNWMIQPVHNFFLIVISDFGILGLVALIWLVYLLSKSFASVLGAQPTYHNTDVQMWAITLFSSLFAVLVLMQFDHYFYTNWSAQLILAMIIGATLKFRKEQVH